MSFIDDIIDYGSTAAKFLSGDSLGSSLARTAILAYTVNRVAGSTTSGNDLTTGTDQPDTGVRLQINPGTQNRIPVVYGSAYLGGIVTDAEPANDNKTMWYAITISERTGTKLSDGLSSAVAFNDIYWNDQRIVFQSDGITADYTVDRDSNVDYSVQGLVRVYCFAGSSTQPVVPDNYSNNSLVPAYSLMPNWTSNHMMSDLNFALVRVDYNRERSITQIPNMRFHITNNMTLPGDCIYDYMTNSRYGAGIDPTEINS